MICLIRCCFNGFVWIALSLTNQGQLISSLFIIEMCYENDEINTQTLVYGFTEIINNDVLKVLKQIMT